MFVYSRIHTTKIIGQRKTFYRQIIPDSSCARKETVDIDILVPSRNVDRKIIQSIRIMSRPPSRKRKWNQLSQFWRISTKVIPTIAWTPYPPFLKEGESKFKLPPTEGGIWEIKRREWKYGVGVVLLKRRAHTFST